MHNFSRVLRLAFRQRLTITALLFTSCIVAVLWGLNIGTLYPIVKVVFQNQGVAGYIEDETLKLTKATDEANATIAQLQEKRDASDDAGQRSRINSEIKVQSLLVTANEKQLELLAWAKPYAQQYLQEPFQVLVLMMALLMIGTAIKLVALTANLMLVQEIAERTSMDVRNMFFRQALRQDLDHFGDTGSSGLTARLTNDVSNLATGINILFGRAVREPLKMVVCIGAAAYICWRLLLVVLIIAPILGFFISALSKSIRRSSRRVMEEMTQLYGVLNEAFAGIRVVKAYNTQAHERARFGQSVKQYYLKSMKMTWYHSLTRPTTELLGMAMIALGILVGGYLVLGEKTHLFGIRITYEVLGPAKIMAFFAFLIGATDPARKLTDVWSVLQRGIAAADRIYEVIDKPVTIYDPENPRFLKGQHKQITFENVNFAYPEATRSVRLKHAEAVAGSDSADGKDSESSNLSDSEAADGTEIPLVLNDLNLKIQQGETVAIVGPNGSGKSTVVSLLCRFYDPDSGAVKLDDIPINELRVRDLRKRIGLVTQRTFLFEESILNNIRYGSPWATKDQIIDAAKRAHADEFIREKTPDGYETLLGTTGVRLSGGQMQRIALARAILRDPEILILDEATSQIDLESEALIHDALAEFLKDRTGIMITHRPTTLELADKVAVIESGHVSDFGRPEDITARNGFYRSLIGSDLRIAS